MTRADSWRSVDPWSRGWSYEARGLTLAPYCNGNRARSTMMQMPKKSVQSAGHPLGNLTGRQTGSAFISAFHDGGYEAQLQRVSKPASVDVCEISGGSKKIDGKKTYRAA